MLIIPIEIFYKTDFSYFVFKIFKLLGKDSPTSKVEGGIAVFFVCLLSINTCILFSNAV